MEIPSGKEKLNQVETKNGPSATTPIMKPIDLTIRRANVENTHCSR